MKVAVQRHGDFSASAQASGVSCTGSRDRTKWGRYTSIDINVSITDQRKKKDRVSLDADVRECVSAIIKELLP